VEDRKATLADVFPNLEERGRLGVVIRQPGGGFGASTFVLAAITAFYDFHRTRGRAFFVYPDYFAFHVGQPFGDHGELDIFPDHKEVVVADNPEELLRAINDRAVTRLLVTDGEAGAPNLTLETLASTRVLTAVVYSPHVRVRDADITVSGSAVTEPLVTSALNIQAQSIRSRWMEFVEPGRV